MPRTWALRKAISPAGPSEAGRRAEEAAAQWLQQRGHTILERNFLCKAGELDLVTREGESLVFVEVKARTSELFGSPGEFVDARKQAKLQRAASFYLRKFGTNPPACRFDVIEVRLAPAGRPAITHLPDAFRPGWG